MWSPSPPWGSGSWQGGNTPLLGEAALGGGGVYWQEVWQGLTAQLSSLLGWSWGDLKPNQGRGGVWGAYAP
jgi:hypothetical protein